MSIKQKRDALKHILLPHAMTMLLQRRCYAAMRAPKPRQLRSTALRISKAPPLPKVAISSQPATTNDECLKSTWPHRLWVASGSTAVAITFTKSILIAGSLKLEPLLAVYLGYILADLGSGVYHWGIDNYGDETTPVFGSQIAAFQGHHKWPWTITKREFANNLHALGRVIALTVLPIDLACEDPSWLGFVGMFSGCIMFSQQFHSWAHGTKSKLPKVVVALQEMGVLVSRLEHAEHHRAPYSDNYCIVSGAWNGLLDRNRVFETLEMVIYLTTKTKPRSWDEPSLHWKEEFPAQ